MKKNILYRQNKRFCSRSCSSTGEFNGMYGKKYKFKEGRKVWTYGLTKNTDERLANLGIKISITQKEQFKNGTRTNKGKNNPNHDSKRRQKERTDEQLENYSLASIQRLLNNQVPTNKSIKTGYYFSNKMKQSFFYRSSFELRTMVCLDNDQNVVSYQHEPFCIIYYDGENKKRRYLPDLLVNFNNKTILVKVKPTSQLNDEKVVLKKNAAENYVSNKGWKYELWDQKYIKKYEIELNVQGLYETYLK